MGIDERQQKVAVGEEDILEFLVFLGRGTKNFPPGIRSVQVNDCIYRTGEYL